MLTLGLRYNHEDKDLAANLDATISSLHVAAAMEAGDRSAAIAGARAAS